MCKLFRGFIKGVIAKSTKHLTWIRLGYHLSLFFIISNHLQFDIDGWCIFGTWRQKRSKGRLQLWIRGAGGQCWVWCWGWAQENWSASKFYDIVLFLFDFSFYLFRRTCPFVCYLFNDRNFIITLVVTEVFIEYLADEIQFVLFYCSDVRFKKILNTIFKKETLVMIFSASNILNFFI